MRSKSGPVWGIQYQLPSPSANADKAQSQDRTSRSTQIIETDTATDSSAGAGPHSADVIVGMGVELLYKMQYTVRLLTAKCTAELVMKPLMELMGDTIYHYSVYHIASFIIPDIEGLLPLVGYDKAAGMCTSSPAAQPANCKRLTGLAKTRAALIKNVFYLFFCNV